MKKYSIFLGLLLSVYFVNYSLAQSSEAKSLLSSTIDKLKSAKAYQGDFVMRIYFGSELEHEEKGLIATAGNQIMLDLQSYKYIANGNSSWTYLKERNEVQINDLSEDDFSMYNPLTLLDHFFEGGFDYEITDKFVKNNIDLTKLDIKPQDQESEYAKVSVILSTKNHLPHKFVIIQKDGTRFEIDMTSVEAKEAVDASTFVFDKNDYPDVIVEDLRLGE